MTQPCLFPDVSCFGLATAALCELMRLLLQHFSTQMIYQYFSAPPADRRVNQESSLLFSELSLQV